MTIFGILIAVAALYILLLVLCVIKCVRKSGKQFKIIDTIFEEDNNHG